MTGPVSPPLQCSDFSPNLSCPTQPTTCVPSDPNLPATKDEFKTGANNCLAAVNAGTCTSASDPGCATACTGPFAVPPAGSTCTPFTATPCGLKNPHGTCTKNSDCTGTGEVCDYVSPCQICQASGNTQNCTTDCQGQSSTLMCGVPATGCRDGKPLPTLCGEVKLCAPPGAAGDPDPRNDPTSNITTQTFDPGKAFTPPLAPATDYPSDPACASPPCTLGQSNAWCTY